MTLAEAIGRKVVEFNMLKLNKNMTGVNLDIAFFSSLTYLLKKCVRN